MSPNTSHVRRAQNLSSWIRAREGGTESGVSLILVLVFLVVGSLLIAAIATAAANDLLNKNNFANARSLSYDASSAIDVAIQSIRFHPLLSPTQTLNASPPRSCWPTSETGTTEPAALPDTNTPTLSNKTGVEFHVWCSTRWNPASASTRIVTLSACRYSVSPSRCALHPTVQEVVTFDDYPTNVASPPTQAACHTYCGRSISVDSWVEHPTMPTIKEVSPSTGSISSATSVTITGTGFVQGSTVEFVEESSGIPTQDNVVYTVTPTSISQPTSLTVAAPSVDEGSTYYVRVTTPAGTSAVSGASVFTYTVGLPAVTSVCIGVAGTTPTNHPSTCSTNASTHAHGPVSGGNEVTIWGTNFWCESSCSAGGAPTVKFVPSAAGHTPRTAKYVTVVSNKEITTTSPSEYQVEPSPGTVAPFYVRVKTPEGSSTASSDTGNVEFDYGPMVPTVDRVTYTNTTERVLITGTGFVAGDTPVAFVKEKATNDGPTGSPISETSFTINSSTQVTAAVPTLVVGDTYFVTVTSPKGTSSYSPPPRGTFTYEAS